ncbi:MAG: hypothetical protein IMZ46_05685 [Acidobacteria bacterium]|nr:hypothetical protein [Acidobacteriota bacterium]
MTVYRIQHPLPAFRGVLMGVDFYGGYGSTSSPQDAVKLVEEGCRVTDPEARAEIRALAQRLDQEREKRAGERKAQEDFERTPAYTAKALERMEEAKRKDPKWKAERLLERQLRRHFGVPIKKSK